MKVKNAIILVGVLGVGGVGAYMFLKNKKAQNALLSGSLPATNQGGATTPSGTNTSGSGQTTTSGGSTTPNLSTQSDGVSPSDANINLANATVLVGERKALEAKVKAPLPPRTESGSFGKTSSEYITAISFRELAKQQIVELDAKLAKLGYKLDATGTLVRI